jgi:hypothetical protein
MVNWVGIDFCQQVNKVIILLHKTFEQNQFTREKPKMVVVDVGSFLENREAF